MPTMLSTGFRRAALCAALMAFATPAFAEHAGAPVEPAGLNPPQATREVCTSIPWGFDGYRNDCRYEVLPAQTAERAPQGICVIAYGIRTCR